MTNAINSVAGVDDFAAMVKDLMAERDKLQADLAAARDEAKINEDALQSACVKALNERDALRADLAAARAQCDVAVQTVGKLQAERDAWRERALAGEKK